MNDKFSESIKKICYLGISLGIIFSISTCSSRKTISAYVPLDAPWVVSLDLLNLGSITRDAEPLVEAFHLLLPENILSPQEEDLIGGAVFSEIDIDSPVFLYQQNNSKAYPEYYVFSFLIKDPSDFSEALLKIDPNLKLEKQNDFQYTATSQGGIAWMEKRGIVLIQAKPQSKPSWLPVLEELFSLEKDKRLEIENDDFQSLLQNDFEIALWFNNDQTPEKVNLDFFGIDDPFAGVPHLRRLYKQIATHISFKTGKVEFDSEYILDQESVKEYEASKGSKLDNDFLKKITVEKPLIWIGIAAGKWGIQATLKEFKWLERTQKIMRFFGMNKEQLFEILSGNIALILDDVDLEYGFNPRADFILAAQVLDQEALDKLLEKIAVFPFFQKKEGYYWFYSADNDYYLVEKEGVIFITQSYEMKNRLVETDDRLDRKIRKLSKKQQIAIHIDFEKISNLPVFEEITDESIQNFRENLLIPFKSLELSTPAHHGNTAESKAILELQDDDQNALFVILEIIKNLRAEASPTS